jgi:hypothetical protein
MEKLEKTLKETSVEEKDREKLGAEYKGLKLMNEQAYADGTSIRYWM